ncbi:MAG: FAD-binding protein [Eggerthellaceae bacterium]
MGVPFLKSRAAVRARTAGHPPCRWQAPRWCACSPRRPKKPAWARSPTLGNEAGRHADGRVIGVEAVQKNPVRIKANKGVVMATGSFAGSGHDRPDERRMRHAAGSNPGATGDGLVMATELGAYTTRLGHAADELVGRP